MSSSDEFADLPEGFSGAVRLFPLPSLVMFPHALQPLHVFEPRYVAMLEDALADDQLLAMALLQPGWEADYDGQPAVFPVICVGRVVSHTRLENGRYNLLLLGLRRASVIHELPVTQGFRRAEIAVIEDLYKSNAAHEREHTQRALLHEFQRCLKKSLTENEPLEQLLGRQLPLGVLADIVAFTLKFDLSFKQKLLSERNVDVRARLLLERLAEWVDAEPSEDNVFPPKFSRN